MQLSSTFRIGQPRAPAPKLQGRHTRPVQASAARASDAWPVMGLAEALGASLLILASPVSARDATPYELANKIEYGINTARGTIRACPSNINPNCISTASTNDTYGPAWRANETDPARAARALADVLTDLYGAQQLSSETISGLGEYRAFAIESSFGQDVAEFLIKPEGSTGTEGALVTYRSIAGSVKYIWPIQQPLSDFDMQRKRMTEIRNQLGWQVIGCELLECYLQ